MQQTGALIPSTRACEPDLLITFTLIQLQYTKFADAAFILELINAIAVRPASNLGCFPKSSLLISAYDRDQQMGKLGNIGSDKWSRVCCQTGGAGTSIF